MATRSYIGYVTEEHNELEKLKESVQELNARIEECRHYLMGVSEDEITVGDALESLGFGRNGLRH